MPLIVAPLATPGEGQDAPGKILDGSLFATLGDVVFGAVDDRRVRIWLASLTGWFEGPGSTGTAEQAAGDGGWLNQAYRAPRTLEVLLRLRGASWDHVGPTLDDIKKAVPVRTPAPMMVVSDGRALQADVRQQGDVLVRRYSASAEVSIGLVAPDPRLYSIDPVLVATGLPQTVGGLSLLGGARTLPLSVNATVTSGVLTVTNDGNAEASPLFTVRGPCSPFTISHRATGATLRFAESVPAGRTLTIDTARRLAVMDQTATRTVTGTWFAYAPGVNEVAFSASAFDASALLISTHRHAYL